MPESTENSKQSITLGDQPTTKDELGFTPYVIAMAEFLTHQETKPPLTISIEGEWGSGKSSFMRQLETEVKRKSKELDKEDLKKVWQKIKDDRIIFSDLSDIYELLRLKFKQETQTVWFNAWRHEKSESLWATFALSFLEQLSNNRNLSDLLYNFWSDLILIRNRLDWKEKPVKFLQTLVIIWLMVTIISSVPILIFFKDEVAGIFLWYEKLADIVKEEDKKDQQKIDNEEDENNQLLSLWLQLGGYGAGFAGVGKLMAILKDLIGDPKMDLTQYLESPDYDKQVAFVEKFHDDFSKIVNAYVGENEKIYVFIDDLDRCELGKSADLLQALNMMISNNPNIIFILGMDREKVAAAISFKQRDVIPFLASAIAENQAEENEIQKLRKKVDYGFSFLEKFVQLSFYVPAPSQKTLDNFVEKISEMQAETKASPEKQEKYFFWIPHSLIAKAFDCSARFKDVKNLLQELRKIFDVKHLLQELIKRGIVTYFWYYFYLLAIAKLLNEKYFRLFSFYFHTLIQQWYYFYLLAIAKLLNEKYLRLFSFYFHTLIQQRHLSKEKEAEKIEAENYSVSEQNSEPQEADTPSLDLPIFPIIEKYLDRESLKLATRMVAPFFDYNPRRLKQYINLLRLRIYIAYYSIGVTFAEKETITTEQIAKFTAITLRYPRLLLELKNNHRLLAQLEKDAVDKSIQSNNSTILNSESTNNQETGNANYWLNNYPKIQQLLCSEMTLNNEHKSGKKHIFENGSIKKLLEVSPQQSLDSKYFKLREFLTDKKWKEADLVTNLIMLQVAGRKDNLMNQHIEKFPCKDLRIIDQLWVKYSDGKFGFSVQKKIYQSVGGTKECNQEVWVKFGKKVGWFDEKREKRWLNYEEVFFEKYLRYEGHLPAISGGTMGESDGGARELGWSGWMIIEWSYSRFLSPLLSRRDL
ncbi:MAG: GUN4 domain-containing protein [Trichodesmium sp. MO_231.B1]|nr:GUN4 domain-containing protein [Trichodesmium sp. MO_231.B1]